MEHLLNKIERDLNQRGVGEFQIDMQNLTSNPQIHKSGYYSQANLNPDEILKHQAF